MSSCHIWPPNYKGVTCFTLRKHCWSNKCRNMVQNNCCTFIGLPVESWSKKYCPCTEWLKMSLDLSILWTVGIWRKDSGDLQQKPAYNPFFFQERQTQDNPGVPPKYNLMQSRNNRAATSKYTGLSLSLLFFSSRLTFCLDNATAPRRLPNGAACPSPSRGLEPASPTAKAPPPGRNRRAAARETRQLHATVSRRTIPSPAPLRPPSRMRRGSRNRKSAELCVRHRRPGSGAAPSRKEPPAPRWPRLPASPSWLGAAVAPQRGGAGVAALACPARFSSSRRSFLFLPPSLPRLSLRLRAGGAVFGGGGACSSRERWAGPGPAGRAHEGAEGAGRAGPAASLPFPGLTGTRGGQTVRCRLWAPRLSLLAPSSLAACLLRHGAAAGRAGVTLTRRKRRWLSFHKAGVGAWGAGDLWCPCLSSLIHPAGLGAGLGRIMAV